MNDRIAAQAIELLKAAGPGRLTFLPLNKNRAARSPAPAKAARRLSGPETEPGRQQRWWEWRTGWARAGS